MDRLGGAVTIGALGMVALVVHGQVAGDEPVPLLVHGAAWLCATGVAWHMGRLLRVISGAVRRARAAVDLLDDAVLVVDAGDHHVAYANEEAARLCGRSVQEVVGMRLWDAGPWPELEDLVQLVDTDDGVLTVTLDERTLHMTATRVAWEGERAYVLRAEDVTAQQLAQRDLAERERRFRTLAEDAAGVVYHIRVQPELEVEYVSPQLSEILGHEPAEWYVDPGLLARLARPDHRASLDLSGDDHVYADQGTHAFSARHADGRWVWLEDHHTPQYAEDGSLVAVQGLIIDVTTQWETEQALSEALRKQEIAAETMHRTARVERTFLQSISHEIRTPMTSALGFARMLGSQRDRLSDDQQDALLQRLVANIERIEQLVGQFLDFDRYARDDTEIVRSLERLDEVAAGVVERVDMQGRQLRTDLELVMVLADRRRVEQTIEGLLRNAVRHTPPETTVTLSVTTDDETARIVVEDDGPGVSPEVAAYVFDPFTQGPTSQEAANPGVGLGLAMVRVAARLHGGEVRHEPVEPQGARFVVELPLAGTDPPAAAGDGAAAGRGVATG